MHCFIFELGLIVAVEAKIRRSGNQQFGIVRYVRIMAGRALPPGNRGMLDLVRELRLVMTPETEVSPRGKKEPSGLCSLFVRLCMAGNTSASLDNRMHHLARKLYLVAL